MRHSVNILREAWSFQIYEHGWAGPVHSGLQSPGTGNGHCESEGLLILYRLLDANPRQVERESIRPDRPNEEQPVAPAFMTALLNQSAVS